MSDTNTLNRLEVLRKSLGFSKKELSDKVGISVNTISNIEKGKNQMSIDIALILANTFNVSLDWLYLKSEEKSIVKSEILDSHLNFSTYYIPYETKTLSMEKEFITIKLSKPIVDYYTKISEIEKIHKEQDLPEEAYIAWKESVKSKYNAQLKSDDFSTIEYVLIEKTEDFANDFFQTIARKQLPDLESKLALDELNS